MERLNILESFEDFRNRIAETFKMDGLSENLKSEIDRWSERRQQKTEVPGVTLEQKIDFQIELADICDVIGNHDRAWEILGDAWEVTDGQLNKRVEDAMDIIMERADDSELP